MGRATVREVGSASVRGDIADIPLPLATPVCCRTAVSTSVSPAERWAVTPSSGLCSGPACWQALLSVEKRPTWCRPGRVVTFRSGTAVALATSTPSNVIVG